MKKHKFFILFLIILFSAFLRIITLNQIGKTFDEHAYVIPGNQFVRLAFSRNFTDPFWYIQSDHPPLGRYFYGMVSFLDVEKYVSNGSPKLHYDLTYSRLVSVFFSVGSVVLVFMLSWEFISPYVAICAGFILAMMPFFLGFSQIATLESMIMFFFTSSVYMFFKYLKSFSQKYLVLTGVAVGLACGIKQSNVLLYPLIIVIFFIWYFNFAIKKHKLMKQDILKILIIFIISFITFFIIWPMPWFHLNQVIEIQQRMWVTDVKLPPPEVFFGKLILIPKPYYIILFLITTPFLLLVLSIFGLVSINKKKNWILYSIIFWFLFPFIQSLYSFKQHGVRYIIEVYAPFSILAAIGIEYLTNKVTKSNSIKLLLSIPIFLYLGIVLLRISPYYLDYFNILVGGTKGVYENKSFQIGWWGQGTREAALYIFNNAPINSTIALPTGQLINSAMWMNPKYKISVYVETKKYDYIMVHHFAVIRFGFNDELIRKNYKHVYSVKADGAELIRVYKK